ncbi:MAG: hypothetical protein ACTSVR_11780 [Candidatus Thorarchaeota archaeon]
MIDSIVKSGMTQAMYAKYQKMMLTKEELIAELSIGKTTFETMMRKGMHPKITRVNGNGKTLFNIMDVVNFNFEKGK